MIARRADSLGWQIVAGIMAAAVLYLLLLGALAVAS
jgi:hypothetical protein